VLTTWLLDLRSAGVADPGSIHTLVAAGEGGEAVPRAACPVVTDLELAGGAQIKSQVVSTPLSISARRWLAIALAVEWLRAEPALLVRVFDNADPFGKMRWPSLSLRKLVPARDRWPRDRPQQMRDEAARDARVEDHRHLAGRHLAGAEALDRALGSLAADLLRLAQVAAIDCAGEIVVALHRGAGAAITDALTPWLDPA